MIVFMEAVQPSKFLSLIEAGDIVQGGSGQSIDRVRFSSALPSR